MFSISRPSCRILCISMSKIAQADFRGNAKSACPVDGHKHLRNFGCKGKHKKKWLPVAIPVANFIFGQKKFVLLYLDVQSGIADQLLQLLHITLTSRLRHVNMAFRKNLLHIAFARARSKCHQTA